jgi:glucosylceramidase
VKHFSWTVDVGARFVTTSPESANAIAFQNPDGSLVTELLNDAATPTEVTVEVTGNVFSVSMPAQSFATLVVP